MLVLSRKEGEQIVIGENIRVTILAVMGNRVRLGLSAPPEVSIQRQELHAPDVSGPDKPLLAGERLAK